MFSPRILSIRRLSDYSAVSRSNFYSDFTCTPTSCRRVWLPARLVERLNWLAIISSLFVRDAVPRKGSVFTEPRPSSGKGLKSIGEFYTGLDHFRSTNYCAVLIQMNLHPLIQGAIHIRTPGISGHPAMLLFSSISLRTETTPELTRLYQKP
jgi:hypothetical protein